MTKTRNHEQANAFVPSPHSPNCAYTFYLLAGMNTNSTMWHDAIPMIQAKYGQNVQIYELFPYKKTDGYSGIRKASLLLKQSLNVKYDASPAVHNERLPKRVADQISFIQQHYNGGKRIIIGHSGGGVIGARAAGYLEQHSDTPIDHIVMVGTPRTSLANMGSRKRKYGGIEHKSIAIASPTDPIPGIGMKTWNGEPKHSLTIDLAPASPIGSHASYFRNVSWEHNHTPRNNVRDMIDLIYAYAH